MMPKERTVEGNDLASWLREAMDEVSADVKEVESGRPGSMHAYTIDALLKELHS